MLRRFRDTDSGFLAEAAKILRSHAQAAPLRLDPPAHQIRPPALYQELGTDCPPGPLPRVLQAGSAFGEGVGAVVGVGRAMVGCPDQRNAAGMLVFQAYWSEWSGLEDITLNLFDRWSTWDREW